MLGLDFTDNATWPGCFINVLHGQLLPKVIKPVTWPGCFINVLYDGLRRLLDFEKPICPVLGCFMNVCYSICNG